MKKRGLILAVGMMMVSLTGCTSGYALSDGSLVDVEVDTSAIDTEAPQVTLKELEPVAVGTELTLEQCVVEALDRSEYELKFQKDGEFCDTFTVEEGEQEYIIVATDVHDNAQEYAGKVTGYVPDTTPPVITAKDRSFSVGYNLDYMKWVSATDDCDGDLTAAVTVDSSGVNKDKPGTYKAVYTVQDAAGNVGTKEITVTVTPKKETAQAAPSAPAADNASGDSGASESSGGNSSSSGGSGGGSSSSGSGESSSSEGSTQPSDSSTGDNVQSGSSGESSSESNTAGNDNSQEAPGEASGEVEGNPVEDNDYPDYVAPPEHNHLST